MSIEDSIADCLRGHRFDDSMPDEVFCHESDDSPMVGLKRGPNPQTDWEEWVDHVTPILANSVLCVLDDDYVPKTLPEYVYVRARTGTSARAWCNNCDFGSTWVSPREAFDWAYTHVEDRHSENRSS